MAKRLPPLTMKDFLYDEFMKPLGISAYKLAKDIHVPVSRIQDILHGRRKMSIDTSMRLGKYFGMDKSHTHAYLYSGIRPNDLTPALARFIYDTRCSIVHNKEAEFHISYNNYEEYKDIVPLMREVHNQLAKEIWNIVNTPNSSISYENSRKIDLF